MGWFIFSCHLLWWFSVVNLCSSGSPYVIMACIPYSCLCHALQLVVSAQLPEKSVSFWFYCAWHHLSLPCVACSVRVLNVIRPVQIPLGDHKESHLYWWPVTLCCQATEGVEWDRVVRLEWWNRVNLIMWKWHLWMLQIRLWMLLCIWRKTVLWKTLLLGVEFTFDHCRSFSLMSSHSPCHSCAGL